MSLTTTEAYKAAIKADTELTRFIAEFGFVPEGAVERAILSSTDKSDISRFQELLLAKNTMPRYATLEPGRWLLDGSFTVLDPEDEEKIIGWWSQSQSDENGTFSPAPALECVLDKGYDVIGLEIAFDPECGEWATSMTVSYYNASNALIGSKVFFEEDAVQPVIFTGIAVKKIVVQINSWNKPWRFVKTSGFMPGQIFVFDGDNTFSFASTEQISPFDTSLKIPEYTITFDNSERKFNIVNPEGLMYFLRHRMKIPAKIGVLTADGWEDLSIGNAFVADWPDDAQEDTAQLICRPYLSFANGYYATSGRGLQTVAQAAELIFLQAGITAPLHIDAQIAGIQVNQYIGERVPLINAAGQLAPAAGGYWKFERDGSYSLKAWAMPEPTTLIDHDNAWSKAAIRQGDEITSVNVKYYRWNSVDEELIEYDTIVTRAENTGAAKEINSAFVPTTERARAIGLQALDYYALRLSWQSEYRGDMSIEAGDGVLIETDYGTSQILVEGHSITWDADKKLQGSITGRGIG